jgi:putative phosphonate metabolism protein
MPQRYGIYFAPAATSELWALATAWLGRDALTEAAVEADIADLTFARRFALTNSARRYGFHATLKAPMALDAKLEGKDLDRALKAFAATVAPVDIGPIVLRPIEGFLALVPDVQSQALTDFVQKIVADFDGFRAPVSEADRAKRIAASKLTPRQIELLDQFGYPYVMEQFRFHMTLTDRLKPEDQAEVAAAAAQWFAPVAGKDLLLDRLVLFHEAEPGAPFKRLRDYPLGGDL